MSERPANDPMIDYRELVRRGYDACAESYAAARRQDDSDQLTPLLEELLVSTGFETVHGRIIGHGYGRKHVGRDEEHPMVLARKRCSIEASK